MESADGTNTGACTKPNWFLGVASVACATIMFWAGFGVYSELSGDGQQTGAILFGVLSCGTGALALLAVPFTLLTTFSWDNERLRMRRLWSSWEFRWSDVQYYQSSSFASFRFALVDGRRYRVWASLLSGAEGLDEAVYARLEHLDEQRIQEGLESGAFVAGKIHLKDRVIRYKPALRREQTIHLDMVQSVHRAVQYNQGMPIGSSLTFVFGPGNKRTMMMMGRDGRLLGSVVLRSLPASVPVVDLSKEAMASETDISTRRIQHTMKLEGMSESLRFFRRRMGPLLALFYGYLWYDAIGNRAERYSISFEEAARLHGPRLAVVLSVYALPFVLLYVWIRQKHRKTAGIVRELGSGVTQAGPNRDSSS